MLNTKSNEHCFIHEPVLAFLCLIGYQEQHEVDHLQTAVDQNESMYYAQDSHQVTLQHFNSWCSMITKLLCAQSMS